MGTKRRHTKYRQGKAGDRRYVPFEGERRVACCGCGLVHRFTYTVEGGKIVETVHEANRETAQIRRAMAKRGDIVAEKDANVYVVFLRMRAGRKRRRFTATYEPC